MISSNSSAHEETAASHWSRLRHRLHDVGSRRKRENNTANPITRPKLGSLVKLATKERKHQSARRMGSLNTQLNQVKRAEKTSMVCIICFCVFSFFSTSGGDCV